MEKANFEAIIIEPNAEPSSTQSTMEGDHGEDICGQDIKSIEINMNIIKHFFINTIALYEHLIKKLCGTCDIIHSEEFVNLHKNLLEFESIFKVFDVTFNKTLLNETLVKKRKSVQISAPVTRSKSKNDSSNETTVNNDRQQQQTDKVKCYVHSCMQTYTSEESARVHFIKNHCKRGDIFDMVVYDQESEQQFDLKRDEFGRYTCDAMDCNYSTNDRSNFKVHLKRHVNYRKFVCVCNKKFYTRDPLMIHFVRVHMKNLDWSLAETDIKTLRKNIRRLINRKFIGIESIDDMPDSDSDLNGPVDDELNCLNDYITQAISNPNETDPYLPKSDNINDETRNDNEDVHTIMLVHEKSESLPTEKEKSDNNDETNDNTINDNDSNENGPLNSFNVSLNLKDNFFTDSVTFRSEGVEEEEIDDLMKNPSNQTSVHRMALSKTQNKVVKKEIPQRQRKYKCPHKFCKQDFFTTKNLLIHLKASHDPENPVACTEPGCSARFKSPALLAQHQKRHQVQYSCSLCPYKTHLAALMTRHTRQHAGEVLHHECSYCHKKFEYLGSLRTHLQKVHNDQEPLKCDFVGCNRKFKTIIGMKKHHREFHMSMKAEISCEWPGCDAVFSNRSSMTNHMRIHTNERPFQCSWESCGKWFRLKETLRRHIRLHQGYRPHVCPFTNCDSAFVTKRSLKNHIEKGHLKSKNSTKLDSQNIKQEFEDIEQIDE